MNGVFLIVNSAQNRTIVVNDTVFAHDNGVLSDTLSLNNWNNGIDGSDMTNLYEFSIKAAPSSTSVYLGFAQKVNFAFYFLFAWQKRNKNPILRQGSATRRKTNSNLFLPQKPAHCRRKNCSSHSFAKICRTLTNVCVNLYARVFNGYLIFSCSK